MARQGDRLEITCAEGEFEVVELLDLSGRVLWCAYLSGETQVSIPVSDYPSGIYIVALSSHGRRVARRVAL